VPLQTERRPARSEALALPAVALAGATLALQSRINGELASRLGSVPLAALVSFSVGGVALLALVTGTRSGRNGVRRLRAGSARWYWWLGGVAGAYLVAVSADGTPKIGVSLVSVSVVAGSVAGSLLVDRLGFGPAGRQVLTGRRVAGAVLAVVAVGIGAVGDLGTTFRPLLLTLIAVAGVGAAAQQGVNGQIGRLAEDARVAGLVNFATGTAVLVVLTVVTGVGHPQWPLAPWLYLGGLVGAVYVVLCAATVAVLGVLRLTLATVAGQLLGSLILDAAAPVPGGALHVTTVAGVALMLLAVPVANRSEPARRARPRPSTTVTRHAGAAGERGR